MQDAAGRRGSGGAAAAGRAGGAALAATAAAAAAAATAAGGITGELGRQADLHPCFFTACLPLRRVLHASLSASNHR